MLRSVNLNFHYQDQCILDNINIDFKAASLTILLGENGAGKSSLLKLLAGLLKPSAGTVSWKQQNIARLDQKYWAQQCSFMPQQHHLSVDFNVQELVSMGRYPYRKRFSALNKVDHAAIKTALIQTDLIQFTARFWQALSGGEQQRVRLARCLTTQTPLLLLDEPTASLDLKHRLTLFQLFKQLAQQGVCVICSHHDLALSSRYADNIILLHQGKIHAQGKPQTVLTSAHIKQVFSVNSNIYQQANGALNFEFSLI